MKGYQDLDLFPDGTATVSSDVLNAPIWATQVILKLHALRQPSDFENISVMRWCRARDLFGSQIPVTTGGFELQISCIRSRYARDSQFRPSCGLWNL